MQFTGYLTAPASDGTRDVTAGIQRLINENPHRTIFFPDGVYRISSPILTPADPAKSVALLLSDFAVIQASEDWRDEEAMIRLGGKDPFNSITINGSNYGIAGGIIDGNGVADAVSVDSGRETYIRDLSIKHARIGIHVKRGANSGSSDIDVTHVNIVGTDTPDSIGVLVEGYDNTFTNMRIAHVFTGFDLRSAGNVLRNLHPLFCFSAAAEEHFAESVGFFDRVGNNWMDFCYSDQFATGFRFGENARQTIMNDCFAFWYTEKGGEETLIGCDGAFEGLVNNVKVGFKNPMNHVLRVGRSGGKGVLHNLNLNHGDESFFSDGLFREYLEGKVR